MRAKVLCAPSKLRLPVLTLTMLRLPRRSHTTITSHITLISYTSNSFTILPTTDSITHMRRPIYPGLAWSSVSRVLRDHLDHMVRPLQGILSLNTLSILRSHPPQHYPLRASLRV